jgi:hypothetical protein
MSVLAALAIAGASPAPLAAAPAPMTVGMFAPSAENSRPASNVGIGRTRVTFVRAPERLPADGQAPPVVAVAYSEGYQTRARVHKLASLAILPLFAAEGYLGQSLYNNPTSGKRDAHLAVAAGIGALFAVNTVTGVWNLVESRKDPNGRRRRVIHSILMIAADAGFFATALLGPESEFGEHGEGRSGEAGEGGSRTAHRAMAFTSIGAGALGYLVMLLGGH